MRKFIEDVLSDSAELVLMLGDWLYETCSPVFDYVAEQITQITLFMWTQFAILLILLLSVIAGSNQ